MALPHARPDDSSAGAVAEPAQEVDGVADDARAERVGGFVAPDGYTLAARAGGGDESSCSCEVRCRPLAVGTRVARVGAVASVAEEAWWEHLAGRKGHRWAVHANHRRAVYREVERLPDAYVVERRLVVFNRKKSVSATGSLWSRAGKRVITSGWSAAGIPSAVQSALPASTSLASCAWVSP